MMNQTRPRSSSDTTSSTSPQQSNAPGLTVVNVVFGERLLTPWHQSLYREEVLGTGSIERLYVCPTCFTYTSDPVAFVGHRGFCDYADEPPGIAIWEKGEYSLFHLDGEEDSLYAQHLSLFAKFFIDNKSVCFDVTTFDFFLLVKNGLEVVGFFSKEKLSWDSNNLACILVFPPWQRRGLGQLLMDVSYKISLREGRIGGPERPLSKLGQLSYLTYWSRAVAHAVLAGRANRSMSVREISVATAMIPDDVVNALGHMGVLGNKRKDGGIMVSKKGVKAWIHRNGVEDELPVQLCDFFEVVEDALGDYESDTQDENENEEEDEDEDEQ